MGRIAAINAHVHIRRYVVNFVCLSFRRAINEWAKYTCVREIGGTRDAKGARPSRRECACNLLFYRPPKLETTCSLSF